MIKELKTSFLLLTVVTLTACGLASPSDPYDVDPDQEAPKVKVSTPVDGGTLLKSDSVIVLQLTEAIKPSTLKALNTQQITTDANFVVEGEWRFNESTNELIFTLENRPKIPAGQQIRITINDTISDAAGNFLVMTRQFNTPALFDVMFKVSGLATGDELKVVQTGSENEISIDANDQNFMLDTDLENDATYQLAISQQPQNSFCALSNASGPVANKAINITIKCHNVVPLNPSAGNWNDFLDKVTREHSGVLRTVSFPDLSSCQDLTGLDFLGVFDWRCTEENVNNATQVRFTSTGLKPNKGLSDLINFDLLHWRTNSVAVNQGETVKAQTDQNVWWNNPIVNADTPVLNAEDTIYLLQKDSTANFTISGNGISLLIKPGIKFNPDSLNAGIYITNPSRNGDPVSRIWIEGEINARFSSVGIKILKAGWTTLNQVTVYNANTNGIEIEDSIKIRILNSLSTKNKGAGIYVISDIDTERENLIRNTHSTKNGRSGIVLAGSDTTLINVTADHNNENGIEIKNNNNKLFHVSSSNNLGDGLLISGAINNIISLTTITSNRSAGIRFISTSGVAKPSNNFLANLTIANNLSSSLVISDYDNNDLVNILDAYNGLTECAPLVDGCENVSIITTGSSADYLFSTVNSETNITFFEKDKPVHIVQASKITTFENPYRAWGSTVASGSSTCNTSGGLCTLLDWSLNQNSSAKNTLLSTDATSTNSHLFAPDVSISYLVNATEILNDGIGNDNSLCEANETCLFTPNTGSYQGHGELTPLESINEIGVTLVQYSENGR